MAQYIDKSALVAEIERRRDFHYKYYMKNGAGSIAECKYDEDRDILSLINALETKEVDLKKDKNGIYEELSRYTRYIGSSSGRELAIAHHFYQLGLAQKGE